jgi:mRNA-degrading endonuclease RelE of RelBE toxin-antitoxin system
MRKISDVAAARRILAGLRDVAAGRDNVDVVAVVGHSPWQRLRVGDRRVLLRPAVVDEQEILIVLRVVPRGELEQAVSRLPSVD